MAEFLVALCDAVDSAPKAAVVTETLSSTPIEISEERYNELTEGPILKYKGKDYLISLDKESIGKYVAGQDASDGAMYMHQFTVDDGGYVSTADEIILYLDSNNVGHVVLLEQ